MASAGACGRPHGSHLHHRNAMIVPEIGGFVRRFFVVEVADIEELMEELMLLVYH